MTQTIQPKLTKMEVTLQGYGALIMNNGRAADETEATVIAKKAAFQTYQQNPTDANREFYEQAQVTMCAYWDNELGLYMPWDNIASMLVKAGTLVKVRGNKTLKVAAAAVTSMYEGFSFSINGQMKKNWDTFVKEKGFRFRRVVRQQKAAIVRTRVKVPTGWELTVRCECVDSVIQPSQVYALFDRAGMEVGLGDWRPSSPKPGANGRFMVKDFKEVK